MDPRLGLVEVTGPAGPIETLSTPTPAGPRPWPPASEPSPTSWSACRGRCSRLAREHAVDRVQFDRPIAGFQAVRHRLAESLVAIEAADAAAHGGAATTARRSPPRWPRRSPAAAPAPSPATPSRCWPASASPPSTRSTSTCAEPWCSTHLLGDARSLTAIARRGAPARPPTADACSRSERRRDRGSRQPVTAGDLAAAVGGRRRDDRHRGAGGGRERDTMLVGGRSRRRRRSSVTVRSAETVRTRARPCGRLAPGSRSAASSVSRSPSWSSVRLCVASTDSVSLVIV